MILPEEAEEPLSVNIVSALVARSGAPPYEVELIGKDAGERQNGGTHPWSLEDGTDSTLILFNPDKQPQDFDVHITGKGEPWVKRYKLSPFETKSLDLHRLAGDQVKDESGSTLSKDTSNGQIGWTGWGTGVQGRGRMLQSNRSTGMARNFSCSAHTALCRASWINLDDPFMYQDTVDMGTIEDEFCQVQGDQCHGVQNYSRPGSGTWYSANPQIASIAAPNPMSTVKVYGAAPGDTSVRGSESLQGCTVGVNPPVHVQIPTSFPVVSMISNGAAVGCPTNTAGWTRVVLRQVTDQNGKPIQNSNQVITESVVFVNNGLQLPPARIGTALTNSNGQTEDVLDLCSTLCPSINTSTEEQSVFDTGIPLGTYTIVKSCFGITVNGQ